MPLVFLFVIMHATYVFLIKSINYEYVSLNMNFIANPADNTIPCLIFHMLSSGAFISEALAAQFTCRAVYCT